MKIIRPVTTICDHIVSTNVTMDVPLYNASTTYSKDALVTNTACGAVVYKSVANSNTGHPVTDTSWWIPYGTSNYYALFDAKNGTQTERMDTLYYEVEFESLVNAVSLINVDATTARFEVWDSTDTKVIDVTVGLTDYGVNDWYEYYFKDVDQRNNYINFDLPSLRFGKGRLTLTNNGAMCRIGSLIYGNQYILGESQWGASLGIKDYSTKEVDDFGNYIIVERAFSDRIEADVVIEHSRVATVKKVLAQYRAQPVVWAAGDTYDAAITFGYYRDFSVILSTPAFADCTISIEGLI